LNVLVVGSGSREHAITWKIAKSPKVHHIYIAPGNSGTSSIGTNLDILPTDIEQLGKTAKDLHIDLTIVGPEASLAIGIVDHFQNLSLPVIGPTKSAAQIESSKVFSKALMKKYAIPCAESIAFNDYAEAWEYVKRHVYPVVIKADGLAAGKGVFIADTQEQAQNALTNIMKARIFGAAGDNVIVEEYLTGKEVSILAFTDGHTAVPMVPACDYKRVFDDDLGDNTGGMGSYSPPLFFDDQMTGQVMETIINPTINAMNKEGFLYKGVLYAGLMITSSGPKVLEFNARFGDPETQVVLPLLETDLVDIFLSILDNNLSKQKIKWKNESCVGVVATSEGYPGNYQTGFLITGLDKLDKDIMVFHAGTKTINKSDIITNGGRVLTVIAVGKNMAIARQKVYTNLPRINFRGCHYRKDIALREVI
jgi:phosphoribosylamine---glycine ligase